MKGKKLTIKLEEYFHKHEVEVNQKWKELNTTLGEINRLKEWKRENLQDIERKDQEMDQLKMKEKEAGKYPLNEGTSSKSSQVKIDEYPDSEIPQIPDQNEEQNMVKNVGAPRSNVEGLKDKDQQNNCTTSKKECIQKIIKTRHLI